MKNIMDEFKHSTSMDALEKIILESDKLDKDTLERIKFYYRSNPIFHQCVDMRDLYNVGKREDQKMSIEEMLLFMVFYLIKNEDQLRSAVLETIEGRINKTLKKIKNLKETKTNEKD